MGYFRLDLPDAGILTIEEGWLGDLPDDPELVRAFGFPNGESSIRTEEDYRFLTTYAAQAGIYHLSVIGGKISPYQERTIRAVQHSWPPSWGGRDPWLRPFGNARRWINETEVPLVGTGDPLAASIPASCGGD